MKIITIIKGIFLLPIGMIFVGGSGIAFYMLTESQSKLLRINSTQTSSAEEIKKLYRSAKDSVGDTGGFKRVVKLNGKVKCEKPQVSLLTSKSCVYYEMRVIERYEGTFEEKDSEGHFQTVRRTVRDTVANNSESVRFDIEDPTGRITIHPNGAKFDPIEVLSKFDNYVENGKSVSYGGFSMKNGRSSSDHRILGYEFSEKIIPLEHRVFVVGEATDRSGELLIQKPVDDGASFIITLKSEEEVINQLKSDIWKMATISISFLIAGLLIWVSVAFSIKIAGMALLAALILAAALIWPLIAGSVLIGLCPVLIYLQKKSMGNLLEIKSTQISSAKDLKEVYQSVKDGLGSTGGFKQLTEVKGVVKCDKPLVGELSKQLCVYYEMKVLQHYEELGSKTTRTIANNSKAIPFEVEDATGRITVNPNGADIEPIQAMSTKEQNIQGREFISYGGLTLSFKATQLEAAGGGQIVGYEFVEKIIPLDGVVYVIGEATDTSGELMIQKSSEKGKPFIITVKSEDELKADTELKIRNLRIGAIVSLSAGLVAIVYGLLSWYFAD